MISLPKPLSQRPTGMPQRRRKSGLRTAAGSLQEQFLDRMARLAEDPTLVLATSQGPEPRPLARLRRRLEALKAGRTPLAARFDAHVLGATYRAMQLADWEAVPRMMDAKIAGQRRFYVQRGQVVRTCTLGVQNFDEPRVLLLAYASMAQRHGLHFFALPDGVVCTGKSARPPAAWADGLARGANVTFTGDAAAGWRCAHAGRPVVRLTWTDGAWVEACAECGKKLGGLHVRVREGYLGPNMRRPVSVEVRLPDGTVHTPDRETAARYRAGLANDGELAAQATALWRASGSVRWALGDRTFTSAEALADALAPDAGERPVLLRLVKDGFVAESATVSSVLEARRAHLGDALSALIEDGPAFARAHSGMAPRDLVRAAHDEARRRAASAQLPRPQGLGPQGEWIDGLARTLLADGRAEALPLLRRAVAGDAPVPRSTLFAFLHAAGGALDLEARFAPDERAAAQALLEPARRVLDARGEAYVTALAEFLALTGAGEASAA